MYPLGGRFAASELLRAFFNARQPNKKWRQANFHRDLPTCNNSLQGLQIEIELPTTITASLGN